MDGETRVSMTPRGWCVIGAAVTAVGAGLLAVEGGLVSAGLVGILGMAVARWMARGNLGRVGILRRMPGQVFAGEAFRVGYAVRVGGAVGVSAVRVEDTMAEGEGAFYCGYVGRKGAEVEMEVRLKERGVVAAADVKFRSDHPLGFFEAERRCGVAAGVIVYPRPVLTRAMVRAEEEMDAYAMAYAAGAGSADAFRGIRDYRPGDAVSRIHWAATARSGVAKVCEYDPPVPRPSEFTVLFHQFSPPGHLLRPRAFEVALSMVAGLLLHGRGVPAAVTFSGGVNGWVPLRVEGAETLREALEVLACARYRAERSLGGLLGALRGLPERGEVRTYVLSETPVELWSGLLPATTRPLVCLDTAGSYRKIFRMEAGGR